MLEWVAIFQGIFSTRDGTQVSYIAGGFYQLNHQGSPRILEWVACSSFGGSSQLRNQTRVSRIGRWILYHLSHQESPMVEYSVITQAKLMKHTQYV